MRKTRSTKVHHEMTRTISSCCFVWFSGSFLSASLRISKRNKLILMRRKLIIFHLLLVAMLVLSACKQPSASCASRKRYTHQRSRYRQSDTKSYSTASVRTDRIHRRERRRPAFVSNTTAAPLGRSICRKQWATAAPFSITTMTAGRTFCSSIQQLARTKIRQVSSGAISQ